MKKSIPTVALLLLSVFLFSSPVYGVSTKSMAADLLAKTGLKYAPLEGHDDVWSLVYVGFENFDQLEVYVWAREEPFITVYVTLFRIEEEPPRSFLWRLLELNDEILGMKYVIRESTTKKGVYFVDCQTDLSLTSINAKELKEAIENLVDEVDIDYPELSSFFD